MSNGVHTRGDQSRARRRRRVLGAAMSAVFATALVASAPHTGAATYRGSAANRALPKPIVDMAATPTGNGYWLVTSNGTIYRFGDAHGYGSAAHLPLQRPIVGMTSTRSGHGYWLVASDGGIFGYGDAHFYGSAGNIHLAKPIVGMARTASGHGYWLVASDGGVFGFGDAEFHGSLGGRRLARPIVGMAATKSGHGYWMAAADGGIFGFGNARFFGSAAGKLGGQRAVDVVPSPDGNGYYIAGKYGAVDTADSSGLHVDPNLGGSAAGRIEIELVNRINSERVRRGLHPVASDPFLHSYAAAWARHLAVTGSFTHQDLLVILRASNGRLEQAGENLFKASGAGAADAGSAHNGLMQSAPHRANILLPEERFVGVGATCYRGSLVVVEDFATPMGVPLRSHPTPTLQPLAAPGLGGAHC